MTVRSRESTINEAFVAMTHALMNEYDIVDLLSTLLDSSVTTLDIDAGGILLADPAGSLELVASTSEEARVVETIIVAGGDGPCFDCFHGAVPVRIADIARDSIAKKWPKFHRAAIDQGFRAAYAIPMQMHHRVIGVMNLLDSRVGPISDDDARVAQSLADLAVLGVLHERNFRTPFTINEQLHLALDTRILIEQSKGVLAEGEHLTMTEAFEVLRRFARATGTPLRRAAEAITSRSVTTAEVADAAASLSR